MTLLGVYGHYLAIPKLAPQRLYIRNPSRTLRQTLKETTIHHTFHGPDLLSRASRRLIIMTMVLLGISGVYSRIFCFFILSPISKCFIYSTLPSTSYLHKNARAVAIILGFERQMCQDFVAHQHP